ncbi:TetR/AcrR family transcriptional regulator [Pedobacter chitinilyticus]|jgi:AcrR family transcriptional regulator|uniref:TetR/AcrR family transcriptional regulator n=1 Tax=Pedobacter chitinilyticus TaxID=2233776 RepID=A0A3S3QEK9_9SPHI|nr:TetR/AcrR family transcriptional regulator [Pedobacter chitinilyticus]RWU05521.1 TetR/AcrR family transcriptional regulator [Pedobacter chitinilyticus]
METNPLTNRARDKNKSKQQFLDAVGTILRSKGHTALKVNNIAATAGLDKKLIYKYFGSTEQLIDEYIHSQDFWSNVTGDLVPKKITDGGKDFLKRMLLEQFEFVSQNKALQKVLLWSLSEERKSLQKLIDDQEANGEILLKGISDPHFGDKASDHRAVMAILVAGLYYLNLFTEVNGSHFCGIDLKTEEGRSKIRQATTFLVEQTYSSM